MASPSLSQPHSPITALQRRFQSLKPVSQQSEVNQLIASMTMRSLICSSGGNHLYRHALTADDVNTASASKQQQQAAAVDSINQTSSTLSHSSSSSATPRGSQQINNNPKSTPRQSDAVASVYLSQLSNLRSTNFDQCHADTLMRYPLAPVLNMSEKKSSPFPTGFASPLSSSSTSGGGGGASPSTTSIQSGTSAGGSNSNNINNNLNSSNSGGVSHPVAITAMAGVPATCLTDEVFVGSLMRRMPSVMPRLVVTTVRALEDLVGVSPVPAPQSVRAEVVRRISVLSAMVSSVRRSGNKLWGNEWDVLFSRVLHKLLAAALVCEAADVCVMLRENSKVFPENTTSLQSYMITQLASRSSVIAHDSPPSAAHGKEGGGGAAGFFLLSPQPKHVDPASPVPAAMSPSATSGSTGTAAAHVPSSLSSSSHQHAQSLPPFAILLSLAEKMPLPPPRSSTSSSAPSWSPSSPMAVICGCTRILQSTEHLINSVSGHHHQHRESMLQHHQHHLSTHEQTWSWICQAFREMEKELFDVGSALLQGMCCAGNTLTHASSGGIHKFAAGIGKVLDSNPPNNVCAPQAMDVAKTLGNVMGVGIGSPGGIISPSKRTAQGTTASVGGDNDNNSKLSEVANSSSCDGGGLHKNLVRDTWQPPEIQNLHLRRSASYSPSSVLGIHGRRRDALVACMLLAVTTLRSISSASLVSQHYFANASRVTAFEQKVRVPFLEVIAGLAMRLSGLCMTTSTHLVSSTADRISGKAVFDQRTCNLDPKLFYDQCLGCDDPVSAYSPLPLLQLANHCLLFLGNVPRHPLVQSQLYNIATRTVFPQFPNALSVQGLAEETQKLIVSSFFFFVRGTPLHHPLSHYDPLIAAFRSLEIVLKGFKYKSEVTRALHRLDQRRNFGRLIDILHRSPSESCCELADTFGFLKSLPKGEQVLRHLPTPLSILGLAVATSTSAASSATAKKKKSSGSSYEHPSSAPVTPLDETDRQKASNITADKAKGNADAGQNSNNNNSETMPVDASSGDCGPWSPPLLPRHHDHHEQHHQQQQQQQQHQSSTTTTTTTTSPANPSPTFSVFTCVTSRQIEWVAHCCVAHLYHKTDSHHDMPRGCSSMYSTSIDPTTVLLGRKKRRVACVKRNALMAPWRVLLPSVEGAGTAGTRAQRRVPYPAVGWDSSHAMTDAAEFSWDPLFLGSDDDENENAIDDGGGSEDRAGGKLDAASSDVKKGKFVSGENVNRQQQQQQPPKMSSEDEVAQSSPQPQDVNDEEEADELGGVAESEEEGEEEEEEEEEEENTDKKK